MRSQDCTKTDVAWEGRNRLLEADNERNFLATPGTSCVNPPAQELPRIPCLCGLGLTCLLCDDSASWVCFIDLLVLFYIALNGSRYSSPYGPFPCLLACLLHTARPRSSLFLFSSKGRFNFWFHSMCVFNSRPLPQSWFSQAFIPTRLFLSLITSLDVCLCVVCLLVRELSWFACHAHGGDMMVKMLLGVDVAVLVAVECSLLFCAPPRTPSFRLASDMVPSSEAISLALFWALTVSSCIS